MQLVHPHDEYDERCWQYERRLVSGLYGSGAVFFGWSSHIGRRYVDGQASPLLLVPPQPAVIVDDGRRYLSEWVFGLTVGCQSLYERQQF
jgi:hypothetical protein